MSKVVKKTLTAFEVFNVMFFIPQSKTPSPKKRKMDEKSEDTTSVKENIELSPNAQTPPSPPPTPTALSPEQKSKIEQNKLAARIKLAAKTSNGLLVDVGSSWFKALEPEFSKQYFTEVST